MARKKRSNLPAVTARDIAEHPEKLRTTPNGGWAWRCGLCGRYASSLTQKGKLRCYAHGGVPPSKRVPSEIVKAKSRGRNTRPPGRPLEHGFYSRSERVNLQELVTAYREGRPNPADSILESYNSRLALSYEDEATVPANRDTALANWDPAGTHHQPLEPLGGTPDQQTLELDQWAGEKRAMVKSPVPDGRSQLGHLENIKGVGKAAAGGVLEAALPECLSPSYLRRQAEEIMRRTCSGCVFFQKGFCRKPANVGRDVRTAANYPACSDFRLLNRR